ncbi:hypothetical protein HYZ99_00160 [Candidatus Peregrinibacteria bacterium]|nr:hypothetical protein [Candidatus Peregrinibacteria bacterium]
MPSRALRNLLKLELEEQILNGGLIVAMVGIFCPWISGEWLGGDTISYSGFSFYTLILGYVIFLLLLGTFLMTAVPLFGGPVFVKRRYREILRLITIGLCTVLVLAALSVLTLVIVEFQRMEVRFGIYLTLIGSLVALFYAFLRFQEQRKSQVQELFHHPEDPGVSERKESAVPPPPPPPPPPAPAPEEHRLYP